MPCGGTGQLPRSPAGFDPDDGPGLVPYGVAPPNQGGPYGTAPAAGLAKRFPKGTPPLDMLLGSWLRHWKWLLRQRISSMLRTSNFNFECRLAPGATVFRYGG